MKKVISLVLVLMMILSLATTAFAAEGDYTITINNTDAVSSAGHKYDAYQIFSGKLDSTATILTEIQWGQNMPEAAAAAFLAALKADTTLGEGTANIFYNAKTADEVAEVLAKHNTSTVVSAFAKHATATVSGDPVASSTEADAPYTIGIPADKTGYYLVKDDPSVLAGEANKDVSDFILQVVADVTVEHKGSIPTMDKQVSETGSTYHDAIGTGINETHYYRIIAELPDDYRLYDSYYLEFSDKMSKGLTFDEVVEVKALIRSSGTEVVLDPTSYTVTSTAIADDAAVQPGGTHLKVVINDTKVATTTVTKAVINLTADDAIVLVYKAHVNAEAVIDGNGIPNQATIIYSNDPNTNGHGESTPDETNVYPINLNILKVDGKDKTVKLSGAEFVLARTYSTGTDSHKEYAVVVDGKIGSWVHHYEGDVCATHDATETLATILKTDSNGNIRVEGLDPGRYTLREITPPDGYNKLTEDVEISVSITIDEANDKISGMTGNTNQGSIAFTPTTANVDLTIDNYKGDVLPSTGGMGTTLFYILGGLMVTGAAVLLITKKRMSA